MIPKASSAPQKSGSELITGIERQLQELRRDRELMQEQEKESLLLIQNSDLSEYSLVNVRGMDAAEAVEALSAMNDNDRLNIAAYLESQGAWTTEIANQDTKEFGDPFNEHAKDNGMVTEWVARNKWGIAVAFGHTKAECMADARRYCKLNQYSI